MPKLTDKEVELLFIDVFGNKDKDNVRLNSFIDICLARLFTGGVGAWIKRFDNTLDKAAQDSVDAYVTKHIEPALKLAAKDKVRVAVTAALIKMIDTILRRPNRSFEEISEKHADQLLIKRAGNAINRIKLRNQNNGRS